MRTVIGQLKRGGWQTLDELVLATRKEKEEILDTLHRQANNSNVLMIITPGKDVDDAGVMYHATTAETGRFAHMYHGIFDLPWSLKRSVIAKIDRIRGTSMLDSPLPQWMRANVAFEQHLARMGLRTVRCHPRDGFLYPCAWHATGAPQWVPHKHFLDVAFTGTITLNTNQPDPVTRVIHPKNMRCWVTAHRNSLSITLDGIASAVVDAGTYHIVSSPSRSSIIHRTETLLGEGARLAEEVGMFLPVRPFKFALLNSQKAGSEENGSKQAFTARNAPEVKTGWCRS